MKTTKFFMMSMGILLSMSLVSEQTAHAEETGGEEESGAVSKGSSTANFELQPGDGSVPPEIIDPDLPPGTGNKGPLSLDAVSSFAFPTKKLGQESKAPLEASPVAGKKLGLQVTDERGQDLGWNLKVSATPFESAEKNILKGAVMTIPEGELTTKEGVDPLLTPTAFKVSLSPTPTSIMKATKTQGRSSWVNSFEAKGEKVTLAVPSGNKVAAYTSTITWSLEDAP